MGKQNRRVMLVTCCAVVALHASIGPSTAAAQRLRDRTVWARERYALAFDKPDKLSTFSSVLKEWDIHDSLGIADNGRRVAGSPNYDVNFENVIHMGSGVFTSHADTTFSGTQRLITPIRCAVLLQNGRDGHAAPFDPNRRVFQVFTVESRPYTVSDPTDLSVRDSWTYRAANREGLGPGYLAEAAPASGVAVRRPDSSKINVMVGGAAVVRPYILRYNDPTIDATKIRAAVVADIRGDSRDEIVVFVESGSGLNVIVLETPASPLPLQPLNYQFKRVDATTIPITTLQPSQLRSVVAADLDGDGRQELILAVKGGQNVQQRILLIRPSTSWAVTTIYEASNSDVSIADATGIVAADLIANGVRKHSIIVVQPTPTAHSVLSLSLQNGRLVAGPARLTLDAADAAPGSIASMAAGDLDGDGDDELVIAHTRRADGVASSILTRIDSAGSTWRTERLARFMREDLDATMMRRMIVSNLDIDIRQRADVGILYHGDPAPTARDDLFLLWASLPPHSVNDYAVTATARSGTTAPFLPHGWWNIRLVTGLSNQELRPRIHATDYWAKTDDWRPAPWLIRGIVFTPDSGRISDAELTRYASVYNCIVPERQHYTDLFVFGKPANPQHDNATTFYYHSNSEVRRALGAFLSAAGGKELFVLPYLGLHDVNSYRPSTTTVGRYEWFDWSNAASRLPSVTLPPFYSAMLDPSIHAQAPFLGWLTADEPSGLIPPNGLNFRPRFTDTAEVNAAVRAPKISQTLADHYRVIRSRVSTKPIYQIYHYQDDFEFYRNAHDVAMMDYYPYVKQYEMQMLRDGNGNVIRDAAGRPVQQRSSELADLSADGLQFSWAPMLRRQMDHVIRCDKEAAMNIAQGVGENSVSADFDPRTDTLLRTLPRFRNLTVNDARLQVLAPAVLGHRGAFWWDGYTWMGGAPDTDIRIVDPSFNRHDPATSSGTPKRNVFGSLMHHAPNNMATARALREAIDTASAEFKAFIPTFLSESLRGKVSMTNTMPGEGIYDHDVASALHTDPATQQRWLFIVNLSRRMISNVRIQVDGIDPDLAVHKIAGPRFRADALLEISSADVDGAVQFDATLPAFTVVAYTFAPKSTGTGNCWFWPF